MWPAVWLSAGAALTLYIGAVYPLLLAVWKFRCLPPVRKDMRGLPTVSALLAVRDGEQFIRAKLESLLALRYPAGRLEILVVSDGSTDGTDGIVESFADRGVRLLRVPGGGKAAALNAGLQHCSGEILFLTDVRQTLDPDAAAHLAANFADPSVGVATGELRYVGPESIGEQADMELYWRYELWVRRRHSRIDSMFGATGCICAVRRSLVDPIPSDTLTDDAVIPLRAFFGGYRVIVDPEALAFDYPAVEGAEFRRRLRTLAGLWQVSIRMPELFSGANRMRLHFLSHKFSRLVLPWSLLLVVLGTLALDASPLRQGLLAAEALFAALALADAVLPRKSQLKRITSPARTFIAMNAAAFLSIVVFFVPPATLWRTTRVTIRR